MILVDTSVWVDHLHAANATLFALLDQAQIVGHPFIVGELALGHLRQRGRILAYLQNLPQAQTATDDEVLITMERHSLAGASIGYVDAHLLAALQITPGASLWTRDRLLRNVAERLGISARP